MKYQKSEEKIVEIDDYVDIKIPKIIAKIKANIRIPGNYNLFVYKNGSYYIQKE